MKYVSYLRVSTKKQGDSGLGLESQQAIIKHFYPEIEKEFLEVKSGKNITKRPVLREAIQFCKDTGATLVVAKVDRLSRDVVDGLGILKELEGRIKFCDLPGEVDRFTLTLYFAFAERERLLITIRIKNALAQKRLRGEPMGTNLPKNRYNLSDVRYKIAGGQVHKDESESNQFNIMAKSYALSLKSQGDTYQQIVDKLNVSHPTSKGGKWHKGSLSRLLTRGVK